MLEIATAVDEEERATTQRRIDGKYDASPVTYDENTQIRIEIGSATYRTD